MIKPLIFYFSFTKTAANLVENVIPSVSVRQWVISLPMRIRHYLQTHTILQTVLRIVVDEIRRRLITCGTELLDPIFQKSNSGKILVQKHPDFSKIYSVHEPQREKLIRNMNLGAKFQL